MTWKTRLVVCLLLVLVIFSLCGCPPDGPQYPSGDEVDTTGRLPDGQDFQDFLDSGGLEVLIENESK